MEITALLSIAVVLLCFAGLMFTRVAPDVLLMGGVAILLVSGILQPVDAFSDWKSVV